MDCSNACLFLYYINRAYSFFSHSFSKPSTIWFGARTVLMHTYMHRTSYAVSQCINIGVLIWALRTFSPNVGVIISCLSYLCRSTSKRFNFFSFSLLVQMKHWTSVKWYSTHLLKKVTQIRGLHRYVAGTLFFFRVVAFISRVRSFRQNRRVDRVVAHISVRTQSQSRGPNTVTHLCVPTTAEQSRAASSRAHRARREYVPCFVSRLSPIHTCFVHMIIQQFEEKKITINLLSWQNVT